MNAASMLVFLAGSMTAAQADQTVFEGPNIQVQRSFDNGPKGEAVPYNYLMYNGTYMARNYLKPKNRADYGKPDVDLSRLATTYFHDKSPIGLALQRYNWFPGKMNEYHADVRVPVSIILSALDPYANLANLWSEPPIAVLGMDAGTLASYARPTQVIHFTERVPVLVSLSLPKNKGDDRHFHFVQDARDRGACLEIFEGEPREMLEKKGGNGYYQLIVIETYKLPVIEVHKELMTKEAMAMMLGKLRAGGILCYHTSNRYYDLVPVIANAAAELKCAYAVGRDNGDRNDDVALRHRFSSEWVMVARKKEDLAHLKAPLHFKKQEFDTRDYWTRDEPTKQKILWTDQGENSFRGIYRSDPTIDLFANSVYRLERWIVDRTGVSNGKMYRMTQPLHNGIRAWSVRSAEELNREPPITSKEKK